MGLESVLRPRRFAFLESAMVPCLLMGHGVRYQGMVLAKEYDFPAKACSAAIDLKEKLD